VPFSTSRLVKLWMAAIIAAAAGFGARLVAPVENAVLAGVVILIPYGLIYLAMTQILGVSTIRETIGALRRR